MKIVYVTGNWAKVASARQYLEPLGIEVEQVKMDTTEIQSDDNNEIASKIYGFFPKCRARSGIILRLFAE